jgi:hypothetical protein
MIQVAGLQFLFNFGTPGIFCQYKEVAYSTDAKTHVQGRHDTIMVHRFLWKHMQVSTSWHEEPTFTFINLDQYRWN